MSEPPPPDKLHPLLARLLRKAGATTEAPPGPEAWRALLALVSRTLHQADDDRYTLERSIDISSGELQALYEDLERRTAAELAHQRQRVVESYAVTRAALEAAHEGIVVVNGRRELVAVNRRYRVMFGVPEDVPDTDHRALIAAAMPLYADPVAARRRIEEIHQTRGTYRDIYDLIDGRIIDRYTAPVELPDGSSGGRITIFRDITAERDANARLAAQAEALDAQNAQLRQLEADKRRLTQLVVHDLKGPAMAILANAEYMLAAHPPPALAEPAEDILLAVRQLDASVRDLLDVSRAEHVGLDVRPQAVALPALVEEVAASLRGLGRIRGVEIAQAIDVPTATIDRELLRRLLQNLVQNAIRHAPATSTVEIAAVRDGADVVLRVSDAGPGVAPADAERIFAPYATGEAERGGHGLGLVFCRLAAEAHGGRIWVEPRAPRGAVFCVRLPQPAAAAAPAAG